MIKKGRGEKLHNAEAQSVTDLLDRCHSSALVSSADDVTQRGLGQTANCGKLVDRNVVCFAQFQNAQTNGGRMRYACAWMSM